MFRTSSLSFQGLAYVVFSFCVWGGLGGFWLLKDIPRFPNLHVLTSVVVILCGEWLSLFFLSVVKKDKTMSKDLAQDLQNDIQKVTDKFNKQIDEIFAKKEKALLTL